jgi:flagellar export protein FliJ
MRPFRFRAQAALVLRRREHDRALVALAQAQTALGVAQNHVEVAARAIVDSDAELDTAMRAGHGEAQLRWYRSWRVKLRHDRDTCTQAVLAREADVTHATSDVDSTRQRVRSLERLHDNALATWRREAALEEQRTMDGLATLRYTRRDERDLL